MDNFIQLLPDNIANQIAAGEVIQRPASVVKELLENAIDAKATKIEISIKDAGKTLIQVVDNGKGMSNDDALLCFERHATSKIRKAEDLFSLTTKGFRGEALASIAAIAHVEMSTKVALSDTGRKITIEGSEIKSNEDTVCPQGTSFKVKNLFYNVPARRNFLKKDLTEFKKIQDEFERVALAHPDIHLILIHNDNELYNLAATVLRKRVVNVLGNNYNDRLVPIEENTEIVRVKGYVLKPEHARKTKGEQFLFVNDRYFKSPYFNHAITKAFEGLLPKGVYPRYFIYLDVDPNKIDVNVHPTKTEIKFEEEKFIYSILLSSIRLALGKYNITPSLEFEQEASFDIPHSRRSQPAIAPTINVDENFNPFQTTSKPINAGTTTGKTKDNFSKAIQDQGFGSQETKSADWENFYSIEDEVSNIEPSLIFDSHSGNGSSFIIKGSYLFASSKSGLMVIHTKRAIEQIVYTEAIKNFISRPIESQNLLFPIEKEVSKTEENYWNENAKILKQLGFIGEIKDSCLQVFTVPSVLQEESISIGIDHLFDTLAYQDVEKSDIAHTLIASIARSASMAQLNLSTNEAIEGLIEQLFQCDNHTYSPRNKKIIDTISLEEIGLKFK